jgi:hypothetical protein
MYTSKHVRPETLVPGKQYLLIEDPRDGGPRYIIPVTLIAYDPCPAVILVCESTGHKRRCAREGLFLPG